MCRNNRANKHRSQSATRLPRNRATRDQVARSRRTVCRRFPCAGRVRLLTFRKRRWYRQPPINTNMTEEKMSWQTPKIVEIALGAEINSYACAGLK